MLIENHQIMHYVCWLLSEFPVKFHKSSGISQAQE